MQVSVGCNSVCSYCIVPSTRGREVSRPATELLGEAQRLAEDGVREITLLGQNVNSYGRDLAERTSFAGLLELLDGVDGIERLRYTSPHPKDMREDVILAHANLASVCEHIHLPLQSGSSRILKSMRRTYTRERYLDRVAQIREHVPDCALSNDVIVGFPGETEADFEQTLSVVDEVGYDSAFTFVFSPRQRHAGGDDRGRRWSPTRSRSSAWGGCWRSSAAGRTSGPSGSSGAEVEVLVEGPSRTDPRPACGAGRRHNKAVNFAGTAEPGELVDVKITGATSQTLTGSALVPAPSRG